MSSENSETKVLKRNWDRIFKGFVSILHTKQEEIDILLKERKILEDRIKMQHESWASDNRMYDGWLSRWKDEVQSMHLMRSLDAAKSNMLGGLKDRDASLCKLIIGLAEDELDDFKACLHLLTQKSDVSLNEGLVTTYEDKSRVTISSSTVSDNETMESEIKKLKAESEKLALEKNSEVSVLLRENRFVWEQLKRMEDEYEEKLKKQISEHELADAKIMSLLSQEERLQSSNSQKDEIISSLQSKVAKLEAEANKKMEENSKLSQELEALKKKGSASITPLARCNSNRSMSHSKDGVSKVVVKKEVPASNPSQPGKVNGHSKRRRVDDGAQVCETPKLFTSSFKVPKLKAFSPNVVQRI